MINSRYKVRNTVKQISIDQYKLVIDQYLKRISKRPYVKAVYQMGSVGHPSISDIDLIVVVDKESDFFTLNELSIYSVGCDNTTRYTFPHDIFLYDTETFKKINYSLFADNLRLIYGTRQDIEEPTPEERRCLNLQILFDFTAMRLAQFRGFIAKGEIGTRSVLLRVASIKHSYSLLQDLEIHSNYICSFVQRIMKARDNFRSITTSEVQLLFRDSIEAFSKVVLLASQYFSDNYLTYYSPVGNNNSMRLNRYQSLLFKTNSVEKNCSESDLSRVYFPQLSFYHFLLQSLVPDNNLGLMTQHFLSHSGTDVYSIHEVYKNTLKKRLDAISDHLAFLRDNNCLFAMRGNPAFVPEF